MAVERGCRGCAVVMVGGCWAFSALLYSSVTVVLCSGHMVEGSCQCCNAMGVSVVLVWMRQVVWNLARENKKLPFSNCVVLSILAIWRVDIPSLVGWNILREGVDCGITNPS